MTQSIPGVICSPDLRRALVAGARVVTSAVLPTLGPRPRLVALTRNSSSMAPELVDSAATIARRITGLPDRTMDAGAMLARAVAWQTDREAGDGATTALILFQALLDEGARAVAGGADPMRLREGLDLASADLLAGIRAQRRSCRGRKQLAKLAETAGLDPPLARLIGEVIDVVGADGQVDLRSAPGRVDRREYVEGGHWPTEPLTNLFHDPAARLAHAENCAVLLTDLDIDDPAGVSRAVDLAKAAGRTGLVVLALRLSDRTIGVLHAHAASGDFRVVVARAPGLAAPERAMNLQDLRMMTGGRLFLQDAGDTLASLGATDLGGARRVWADAAHLGVIGGQGDVRAFRRHVAGLRAAMAAAAAADRRAAMRLRLGRLLGGSATILIGGSTKTETAARLAAGHRSLTTLRGAARHGVVPGGGVALLAARESLLCSNLSLGCNPTPEFRLARRLLHQAAEAPFRMLLQNAGIEPALALARLAGEPAGSVLDARTGGFVDGNASGILDAAFVVETATRIAIAAAAQALTIDALVLHRNPDLMTEPL